MLYKVVFVILAVVSISHASLFTACDNGNEPTDVKLDNCYDEYCEVRRNNPAKIEVTFEAEKDLKKIKAAVHAQIGPLKVPFPLGRNADVCANLTDGGKCPVSAGSEVTYNLQLTIPNIAPVGTRTTVELKLTDQDGEIVSCTRIPFLVAA